MPINIDHLSKDELLDLNRRVIARLQLLDQHSTVSAMVKFNLGQRVSFDPDGRLRSGTLIKFNPKTVVVLTADGQRWKVSPPFLRHLVDNQQPGNVSVLRRAEKDSKDH